jgi:hypothetical protein
LRLLLILFDQSFELIVYFAVLSSRDEVVRLEVRRISGLVVQRRQGQRLARSPSRIARGRVRRATADLPRRIFPRKAFRTSEDFAKERHNRIRQFGAECDARDAALPWADDEYRSKRIVMNEQLRTNVSCKRHDRASTARGSLVSDAVGNSY